MPIFEEKLICPFAVRFTQEHIRPVFQDGRSLDATVGAITARAGAGDYDLILQTPFPVIEVVRWRHDSGSQEDKDWVTLDNRRLYCLQRAAAALWPRRVAVAVEVLYAATEDILRKCDSSTAGRSVGIGHSPKALIARWDWRAAVALNIPEAGAAMALVAADAAKLRVQELADAPAAPSMLDLFLQGAGGELPPSVSTDAMKPPSCIGSEDSTAAPTPPRSRSSSEHPADESLSGKWRTEQGEVYEIESTGWGCWSCRRLGKGRSQRYALSYHEQTDAVWWGDMDLCLDANQAWEGVSSIQWYATRDNNVRTRRARFLWTRVPEGAPAAPAPQSNRNRGRRANKEPSAAAPEQQAASHAGKRPARARQARC